MLAAVKAVARPIALHRLFAVSKHKPDAVAIHGPVLDLVTQQAGKLEQETCGRASIVCTNVALRQPNVCFVVRGKNYYARLLAWILRHYVPNWEASLGRVLSESVIFHLIALEVCMDKIFSPFVSRAAQGPRTEGDKLLHVSPAALRVDLERLIHCSIDLLLRQTYFSRLRIGRGRTLCRLGSRSRSGTLRIVASQNSDSHNGDCKEH